MVQAGTAISNRRRGEPNGYNFLRVTRDLLEVEVRIAAGGAYAPLRTSRFARTPTGWEADRMSDAAAARHQRRLGRADDRARGAARHRCLSWIDVLYEGPVPAGLDAAALARVRAEAAEALGWAPADEVVAAYAERDAALEAADHVVLWFEHDLHDQLQLLQMLDRLAAGRARAPAGGRRSSTASPAARRSTASASSSRRRSPTCGPTAGPIDPAQLALAQRAWAALRASGPDGAGGARARGDADAAAARAGAGAPAGGAARRGRRPGPQRAAAAARRRRRRPHAAATRSSPTRSRRTRATPATRSSSRASSGSPPARTRSSPARPTAQLALTPDGERVLAGEVDAVRLRGLDRWVGGTHLSLDAAWRWDAATRDVVRG